jgi:hypothetical protein
MDPSLKENWQTAPTSAVSMMNICAMVSFEVHPFTPAQAKFAVAREKTRAAAKVSFFMVLSPAIGLRGRFLTGPYQTRERAALRRKSFEFNNELGGRGGGEGFTALSDGIVRGAAAIKLTIAR